MSHLSTQLHEDARKQFEELGRRTPISNLQLRCSEPAGMAAVVTLRTQNLRDLTFSELHRNSVRVVGKATRLVEEGETMSTFENYGMAMLPLEMIMQILEKISGSSCAIVEFSEALSMVLSFRSFP